MSALADLHEAPISGQHYSSFGDLRKKEFVQVKKETVGAQQLYGGLHLIPNLAPHHCSTCGQEGHNAWACKSLTVDPILVLLILSRKLNGAVNSPFSFVF